MISQSVREIMSNSVRTITADRDVVEAASMFSTNSIGSLVVNDSSGVPDGIVTESDIVEALVENAGDVSEIPLSSILSSPVVTIDSSASIHDAATTMRTHRIKKLPVVESDEIVRIVTTSDLATYLPRYRLDGRNTEETERQ